MTHGTSGMRKGISLVEMMIAIVLLGVLSVIGYKYYKNFFDTDVVSKKARIATVVEQAAQLSSAYDVYQQQFGTSPASVATLVAGNVQILKTTPTMPTVSAAGWTLNSAMELDAGTTATNDTGFVLTIDGATLTALDKKKYCRVFNNMMDDTQLLTNETSYAGSADGTGPKDAATMYSTAGNVFKDAFCYNSGTVGAPVLKIVFVKNVDPS